MSKKGFTLIELIIVVIIIGILAAIAAPMMSANTMKAKKSEAMAALGAIRTALRLYYVEYGSYPTAIAAGSIGSTTASLGAYIKETDLNGRYFNNMAYATDGSSGGCNANTKCSSDSALSTYTGTDYVITMSSSGSYANY